MTGGLADMYVHGIGVSSVSVSMNKDRIGAETCQGGRGTRRMTGEKSQ